MGHRSADLTEKTFWTKSIQDSLMSQIMYFFLNNVFFETQLTSNLTTWLKIRKERRKRASEQGGYFCTEAHALLFPCESLYSPAGPTCSYFSHSPDWLSYSVSQPATAQKQRTDKRQVLTTTKETGDRLEEEAGNLYENNSRRANRNTAPLEFYYNGTVHFPGGWLTAHLRGLLYQPQISQEQAQHTGKPGIQERPYIVLSGLGLSTRKSYFQQNWLPYERYWYLKENFQFSGKRKNR